MRKDAKLSKDRKHRYVLIRDWGEEAPKGHAGFVNFICLNPSTADETEDDPTVRRCIGFAKAWGFAGIAITNLFALRTKDPKKLQEECVNPIGILNNHFLKMWARKSKVTVAAWGVHGVFLDRGQQVKEILGEFTELRIFGLTKDGHRLVEMAYTLAMMELPF